jgi:signal transduction histidine kinase
VSRRGPACNHEYLSFGPINGKQMLIWSCGGERVSSLLHRLKSLMKRIVKRAAATTGRRSADRAFVERRLLVFAWKEALADLTPGLAHDFNNALTGILAMSEVCLAQIAPHHPTAECLGLIRKKAQEAARLIDRLAHLYQDKPGRLDHHDLKSVAREMFEILHQVIPRRIEVGIDVGSDSFPVCLDGVELRRVLLSLALSAISRMPDKGKLQIRIARRRASSAPRVFRGEIPSRRALCLSIADTGPALSSGQLETVFDPFAASEERVAALALAVRQAVLFVEKSAGGVSVQSKRNAGTTVQLWLPETDFTEGQTVAS